MIELFPILNLGVYYIIICLFVGHTIYYPLHGPHGDSDSLVDSFATPQKVLSHFLRAFWIPPHYHYVVYAVLNFGLLMVIYKYTAGLTTAKRNIFLLTLIANPFSAIASTDTDLSAISANLLVLSILQVVGPFVVYNQENLPSHEVAVLQRVTGYQVYLLAAILQPGLLYLAPFYLLVSRTQQLRYRALSTDESSDTKPRTSQRPFGYLVALGTVLSFLVYGFAYYRKKTGQLRPLCNSLWESNAIKTEYSTWYSYFSKLRDLVLAYTHGSLNLDWLLIVLVASLACYYSSIRLYTKSVGMTGKPSAQNTYYLSVTLQTLLLAHALSNLKVSVAAVYSVLALFCVSINDFFLLIMSTLGFLGDAFFFSSTRLLKQYVHVTRFDSLLQEYSAISQALLNSTRTNISSMSSSVSQEISDQWTYDGQTSADSISRMSVISLQLKNARGEVSMYHVMTLAIIFAVFITDISGVRLLSKRKHEVVSKKSSVSVILFGSFYLALAVAGTVLIHLNVLFNIKGLKIALFVVQLVAEPFRMGFLLVLALGSLMKCTKYLLVQTADAQ
ncbi:Hypothetical protein GLP15_1869 [Giardia lamblia P15]|uniref:Uncharacterized protein n=1 Tax=Giardia intestinalis (strain P15) TaxID=658858 RepID=E1F2E0_GIAIA|nr:Hypothetical protein GLP15_1869 [Giardia lamblia P15]